MKQVTELPHLSSEQRAAAKKVVADVDATVEELEAGKLIGAARKKRASFSIVEPTDLQRDWLNTTTASRVEALQREIDAKKALLKKSEVELKMIKLEQLLLKKLVAEKDQAKELEKQRKEDSAQEAMVSKLLAAAKALAAKKPHAAAPQQKVVGATAVPVPALSALVAQLQAQ